LGDEGVLRLQFELTNCKGDAVRDEQLFDIATPCFFGELTRTDETYLLE
jgi:hypothetical protein